MTHTTRFTRHRDSPYFYTTHVEDIGILQSDAYYAIPRQLDLENTRTLAEDEEKVGKPGQVWEVVDVTFGVFESVEGCEAGVYSQSCLPTSTSKHRTSMDNSSPQHRSQESTD